jgi:hypothetical protein
LLRSGGIGHGPLLEGVPCQLLPMALTLAPKQARPEPSSSGIG